MRMSYNLNLEQTQKLIMTPELKQAIEILQYNALELNQFIQDEMMNNPILELNQNKSENDTVTANERIKEETKEQAKEEIKEKEDSSIDWKEFLNEYEDYKFKNKNRTNNYQETEEISFDNFLSNETTLTEHLLFQLQFSILDNKYNKIGQYIVQNIDGNGYLSITNKEVVKKFKVEENEVEDIIKVVQTFDPMGVGARDLKECLLIQLEQKGIKNPYVIEIVKNYLNELGKNKLNYIAKKLDISIKETQEAGDYIKTLEPKPGRAFSSLRDIRYITPDVTVEKVVNEYVIIIKDVTAPRLTINSYYRKILMNSDVELNTSSYITQKLNSALKIIKSIQQRRNTIYKVVRAIIDYQMEFFERGTMHLRPLTLKEIADDIGVHESTVSRAVNGKYMECPRGIFELKYFFQSGVSSAFGDGVSSESIKSIIKDLLENEDSKKPLSDQIISDELNRIGIKVSRRTIAKYRDEANIPSSSKRKRF